MRAVVPRRFQPGERAPGRPTPIDRFLGRDDHARRGRWSAAPPGTGLEAIGVALVGTRRVIEARDDVATIWHVLWAREDGNSTVTVDGRTWPVAPGDSVVVPARATRRADGDQLAVTVAVPGADASVAPATHGEDRFFGYNRQTTCCHVGNIRLCRWKLTQPLDFTDHHPAQALVLALARTSVIHTATSVDRLDQGELAVIDPAAHPIVLPDGLSYLLTIDRDPHTG